MGKNLYITEKPSVAESFSMVLGHSISKVDRGRGFAEFSDYAITWCYGHLVTMAFPDAYDSAYKSWKVEHLPIIPKDYKYVVIEGKGNVKQFETVKSLLRRTDIDMIYVCTDSGREGEYIFRLVYQLSECTKPAKRVWISSQTEDAILTGIKNAKDISEYDSLASSAYSRAKEDWLFGMNFSRIFTCLHGSRLSKVLNESKSSVIAIGRVMTCVLGIVVDRELEIRNFVPKTHYGVTLDFESVDSKIKYNGKWQPAKAPDQKDKEKEVPQEEEKYMTRDDAAILIEKLKGHDGTISKIEIKTKNELPPLLFNLAELQSEASKKFKLPVDKTLEITQSLYEKKLVTYPRTDCRVLSKDISKEIPKILNGLYKNSAFSTYIGAIKEFGSLKVDQNTKRYVDDSKVTDHFAIIPTYVTNDLDRMDQDSKNIYNLIVKRFLSIFYPPAQYNTVKVSTLVDKELFLSNAKTLKDAGWKAVYDFSVKEEDESSDSPLHNLIKKEKVTVLSENLEEKETKPPSRYTDGSLILTMEKAGKFIENEELREQIKTTGIGTSATRSSIIKKLKDIGYMSVHTKSQVVTPTLKGEAIVELVRRTAKELLNPSLTASWEKGLVMIEKKETTEEIFMGKLYSYIERTIQKVKNSDDTVNLVKIMETRN